MIALRNTLAAAEVSTVDIDLIAWVHSKRRPRSVDPKAPSIALADLFSGCGGLTLGALEAIRKHGLRADIKLAVDLDADCVQVYSRNFKVPANRLVCGSIADLVPGALGSALNDTEAAMKAHIGKLDLALAGPPCQGHSDLNNHSRRDDPKNLLYLRAIRFVEVTLPRVAIIENVPGARHDKSQVFQTAVSFLQGLGYSVDWGILSAHRFGLPQQRKRLVMIAVRYGDLTPLFAAYENQCKVLSLKEMIGDLEDEFLEKDDLYSTPSRMTSTNLRRVDYLFKHRTYDLPNSQRPTCHRDKEHSYKSMYGRMHWDRLAQTVTGGFGSMGQGRYIHPSRKRVITPHEAARIQGFPDHFDFSCVERRTSLHQMIGNAVPPVMAFQPVHDLISGGFLSSTP